MAKPELRRTTGWSVARTVLRDPLLLLAACLQLVLGVALASTSLTGRPITLRTEGLVTLTLVALLIAALAAHAGRYDKEAEPPPERRFWYFLMTALTAWLATEVLLQLGPQWTLSSLGGVLVDAGYVAFYAVVYLATEERPESGGVGSLLAGERLLVRRAAAVSLTIGLFVYFAVIPAVAAPQRYAAMAPSFFLYAVLDFALAERFMFLALRSGGARWRAIHWCLGFAFFGWGCTDLLDAAAHANAVSWQNGTPLDLIWFLPFLPAFAAARMRFRTGTDTADRRAARQGPEVPRTRGLDPHVLGLTLVLPFTDFIGYQIGALEPALRGLRSIVVLAVMALLVGLAAIELTLSRAHLRILRRLEESRKMDALGRLAAGVAHDFNNVLQAIQGNAERLAAVLRPDQRSARDAVAEIALATDRATRVTRQLLDISRHQASTPQMLDVNEVVGQMQSGLAGAVGEGVSVFFEPAGEPALVWADRGQLERVLLNLAANARDAMEGRGTLTITATTVEISEGPTPPAGRYVKLSVADSGPGIPPSVRAHLFEPFFTTKAEGRGSGLGLAIVYGIVHQADGHIQVRSKPGEGATFSILFPLLETGSSDTGPAPVRAAAPMPHGPRRILLAEDDRAVRDVLAQLLEGAGHRVTAVGDGEQALAELESAEQPFDVLLTDLNMPVVDGLTLAGRARALTPSLAIILMSGDPAAAIPQSLAGPAEVELLAKPFSAADLFATIHDAGS